MIFCTRKVSRGTLGGHNTIDIRSLKNYSKDIFQQSFVGSNWSNVLISNEVDTVWNYFKINFLSVLDENATVKLIRIKQLTEAGLI